MRYRLYLYNTTAVTGSALAITSINSAIGTESDAVWNHNEAAHFMKTFAVDEIRTRIEQEVGDKCRIVIKYPPRGYDQIAYLYIATSYERVREVLPKIYAIAAENSLVLYDAEKDRSFYLDLLDETFVSLKIREREIRERILDNDKRIWSYKRISFYEDERDKRSSFVVTLSNVQGVTFRERIQRFYNTLKEALINGEELICENECFTVSGKWYSITYCVEGYKKHVNRIGFMENGEPCERLLKRMGCNEAIKWMANCTETEKAEIASRMHFREMVGKYKNPADRFVKSVNITKWQRKELFGVRYSSMGYYGSEILFHIVRDAYELDGHCTSVLKIEEESATFILPFVADFYPHIYERYYLTENHLPTEMWRKVIDRIAEAKKLILYDTFNPVLKPYIGRFDLYVLSKERNQDLWESEDGDKIRNTPEQFLYEHRYDVAHLYDVFIEWSKAQMKYYCESGDARMFNIQGP